MKILFLVNELLTVSGITKHFYYLLAGLLEYEENEYFIICGGGNALKMFENLGVKIIIDKNIRHESRTKKGYLKGIISIYSFVKKNRIDIIHAHNHYAANIAHKVSIISGVATVQTNHGILPELGTLNHFPGKNIIAVNEHIINYVKNRYANKKEVVLIRNGLPKIKLNKVTNKKLKVIAASRLNREKGLDLYITAISKLPTDVKNKAEFYIAGEGDYETELKLLNNEVNAGVMFFGAVDNLIDTLSKTDIFVMPTRSKTEGFPMTIIEAGITKNLIISSNFWGLTSVFQDSVDGFVFQNDDSENLSKTLERSIIEYQKLSKLIMSFHSKVEQLYNDNHMVQKTLDVYKKCKK